MLATQADTESPRMISTPSWTESTIDAEAELLLSRIEAVTGPSVDDRRALRKAVIIKHLRRKHEKAVAAEKALRAELSPETE